MAKSLSQSRFSQVIKTLYRKAPKGVQNRVKRVVAESLPRPTDQSASSNKAEDVPGPNQNAQKIAVSAKDIGSTYNSEIVFSMIALEHNLLHQQLRETKQEAAKLRRRLNEVEESRGSAKPASELVEEYLTGQSTDAPRHLVLTSEYPRRQKEVRTSVLHQRIKRYQSAGVGVDIICSGVSEKVSIVELDGVRILEGRDAEIASVLAQRSYTSVSVHFLTPAIWAALEPFLPTLDVHIFVHGRETSRWVRKIPTYEDGTQLEHGMRHSIESQFFWHKVLNHQYPPKSYIFRSDWWRRACGDDLRNAFPTTRSHIIADSESSNPWDDSETLERELRILGLGD